MSWDGGGFGTTWKRRAMDLEFEFAGASYPRSTYPSIFLFLVDRRSGVLGKRRLRALLKTGSELHQTYQRIFSYVDIRPRNPRPKRFILVNIHRSARNRF